MALRQIIISLLVLINVASADFASTIANQTGYNDLQACAKRCLISGDSWTLLGSVGCSTSTCLCVNQFDQAFAGVTNCVPGACSKTVDLAAATSILKAACSTEMGVGWVAPQLPIQRTFTTSSQTVQGTTIPVTISSTATSPATVVVQITPTCE